MSKQPKVSVEDHGNGLMVLGVSRIKKARKIAKEYVGKGDLLYACPTYYKGHGAVWFSGHPGAMWDGAVDHVGRPTRGFGFE